MRNLLSFLLRHNAFILFILLEVASIILLIRNNNYHQSAFVNSSNVVAGKVFTIYNNFVEYLTLKGENERLANENAELRSQLKSSYYNTSFQQVSVTDSAFKQMYNYIPAKVINITTNKINNYITIDKGLSAGVKVKMAVIGSDGIVGIVKDVSENFSTIISLIHKDFRISARVGAKGNLGSLSWNGQSPEYAQLDEIPKQIKISVGDKVYTSGSSLKFPENILVGTISAFSSGTTDNFYDIEVKLSTNFSSLSYVYVVNNLMKDELEKLENRLTE
jgi:rod shape-determining protein MreC